MSTKVVFILSKRADQTGNALIRIFLWQEISVHIKAYGAAGFIVDIIIHREPKVNRFYPLARKIFAGAAFYAFYRLQRIRSLTELDLEDPILRNYLLLSYLHQKLCSCRFWGSRSIAVIWPALGFPFPVVILLFYAIMASNIFRDIGRGCSKMGKELMAFYRDKVKKNWKIAFLAVVIIGLLTHLYKFTNYLPDRDSFLNLYNDQNVIQSGRWFLSIACGLGSYFDLPMVNGILSVFYIALTMVFLVELFHMENPVLIVLSAGILVTFPGVTETFLYEYTADGYMLAMLLSAAAVFLTRMQDKIGWKAYLASGICLCLSCAIYQAYVSFALVLVLCHFMYELLENRWEWKQSLQWALKQVLLYAAAMAAYYIIWKVCLLVQNAAANDYQGISNIGTDILATFLGGFKMSLTAVATFFLQWNIFKFGLTLYSALNILFLVLCTGIFVTAVVRSGLLRRKPQLLMFGLALVLFIPCCCIWAFVSKEILYRSMMLLALALLYIFALVLYERWAAPRWANIAAALLAVIVFNFSLMANICYYYLNQCYEKTYATGIRIMMDIDEMEEGHSFDRIAIVGDSWTQGMLVTYDKEKQQQTPASSIGVISKYMYDNLMYEHLRVTTVLNDFLGVDLKAAPLGEVLALEKDPEVMQMPLWPEEGSMIVRDDTLIIKIH